MGIISKLEQRPAPKRQARMYAAARASRLTAGWQAPNSSADAELVSSLTTLRGRSRALVRDAAYAKRAKVIVQNNVIGAGIGMQAQVMSTRDTLREDINDAIEEAWRQWCYAEQCHTGGTLCFADLERAVMGQIFETGEVFIRKHYRAFGNSRVPFALELIEPERIADELAQAGPGRAGGFVRMGIEVDDFYRPLGYWIRRRHPSEFRLGVYETDLLEWVPASQVIHVRIPVDRWPQTRGEPWLHAVAKRLNDMDGYSDAEITAARGAAAYMGVHKKRDPVSSLATTDAQGNRHIDLEPGTVAEIYDDEEFEIVAPNRPNPNMDPFMRLMLREICAGAGPSYESISRDYSQSNFSSNQIAVHEDRDLWRVIQQCFIRNFRQPLHREWLQQAVLGRAIPQIRIEEYAVDAGKFEAVSFKPRGWGWVRPREDVPAMIEAHKAGFLPMGDIIAMTCNGKDFWDVMKQIQYERDVMKQLGLTFTTSPEVYVNAEKPAEPPDKEPPEAEDDPDKTDDPQSRVVSFVR